MNWKLWYHRLFPEEFVIDERPAEVFEQGPGFAAPAASGKDSLVVDYFGSRGGDLRSQLSDLMLEQVRLAEHARMLEQAKPREDEFGRFVKQALPFLDNFAHLLDLAREHPPSEEVMNWLRSVEALYFRLVQLLENYGLRFINSLGKPVNFDIHEVIEYRASGTHPHNTIIKELQKGVVFRERLLRDAKVVVACNE